MGRRLRRLARTILRTVKFAPPEDDVIVRASAALALAPATLIRGAAILLARSALATDAVKGMALPAAPTPELVAELRPLWHRAFAALAELAALRRQAAADGQAAEDAGDLARAEACRAFQQLIGPGAHVEILPGGRHRLTLANGSSGLTAPPGPDDPGEDPQERAPTAPANAAARR